MATSNEESPNIVVIVMDDLGFNDVPWHLHTNTQMPFLQQFVTKHALKIDTFYAMPLCSMTRSALLTGRYCSRYGLQSSVIENGFPFGLSVFESIMTRDFKAAEYNTFMIGKWHLGFHRHDLTPLQRGFDEFRGSLSPMIHYFDYNYSVEADTPDTDAVYTGHDLWINAQPISPIDTKSQYLTDWEGDQFIALMDEIAKGDSNGNMSPFFMYIAMHASHDPREATPQCLALYSSTDCVDREWEALMNCEQHQIMQSQSSCADQTQRRMIEYLQNIKNGEIWSNTLLIWLSDNGAPPWDGDNSPLRGAKKELYEGGVRTPAFVSGGYLNKERYGKIFDADTPFHVVDWYPTLLSAAGIASDHTGLQLDGVDQWNAIQYNIVSPQADGTTRQFLYNVDPMDCETVMCGAYRYGRYKFIWTQNTAPDQMYWSDFYARNGRQKDDASVNTEYSNYLGCANIPEGIQTANEYDANGNLIGSLPCGDRPCLFDIGNDPCEYNDLSMETQYENLYLFMYNMLMAYYESQQVALRAYYDDKFDVNSDPKARNGYWSPWIRDYDAADDILDFEDVMRDSQDVTLSQYYALAMEYKEMWDEEVENGVSPDSDIIGAVPDGKLKQFKTLITITVIAALFILIGVSLLCLKWSTTCCRETEASVDSRIKQRRKGDALDKSTSLFEYENIDKLSMCDVDSSYERTALLRNE